MEVKPGYKQTDVGVIPEDWEVKTLGQVGEALIGLTYQPGDVRTHGTLVLRSSNIQEDALRFENNVFVEKEIPDRIMVRPGDILICVRNGSRDLIGKTALLDDRTVGMTFGAFMAVFRSTNGQFINYLFQSRIIKKQINEHLGATINQITNKSLNSFLAPLPPTEAEQRSIATVLSDMDALLRSLDQLIAKKRDLKQATMQQLLTGKKRLPGFGEGKGYKEFAIGVIPEDWNVKKIKDIAPLQRGFDLPTSQLKRGDYPVVYSNGVMNHHAKFMVQGPGVVTGRSGTIGNVHYVCENYWPHNTALWVTDFMDSHPKYIYYFYKFLKLERFGTGSGVPTLNRNDVHDSEVVIPGSEEQRAIANVLCDMDTELAALEQRCDKTRALKQGIMQELLTGRTRLL
ncbi:MAG: restriction endonuclease subunit S (plasmid) [Stenomitos frigidus ULC029]